MKRVLPFWVYKSKTTRVKWQALVRRKVIMQNVDKCLGDQGEISKPATVELPALLDTVNLDLTI